MLIAITREISPAIQHCELTHLPRAVIDLELARGQHQRYEHCLAEAGCQIRRLASDDDMPDSVFVEDIAVVVDECAVILRPGAQSRRVETHAVTDALSQYRSLRHIEPPGTVDGGDVLALGRHVFVGYSRRTNAEGVEQLRRLLGGHGYLVRGVPVQGCVHLKSAVTAVADQTLLLNRQWITPDAFSGFEVLDVHPAEPLGANAVRIGDTVIYPTAFPRTGELLQKRGYRVRTVDVSELAKAEGAVTCCSLIFSA